MVMKRLCGLGPDENDLEVSFLHLSGHLTPGAGCAEGRIHTVLTHGALKTQYSDQQVKDYQSRLHRHTFILVKHFLASSNMSLV